MKVIANRIFLVFFCWMASITSVNASAAPDVKALLKVRQTLEQTWLTSQNYAYGLTVKADPFKALVWQYVYVTLLPRAYPGSYSLLAPYKSKLPETAYDEAFAASKEIKKKYHLPERLDEKQFLSVFEAKQQDLIPLQSKPKAYPSFNDFLKAVAEVSPELADDYRKKILELERKVGIQIVYGRLQFNGEKLEQSAVSNQLMDINESGFFLSASKSPLYLTANGYQSYVKHFESTPEPLSLGLIALDPLPETSLGSVVGRIEPLSHLKEVGLLVKFKDQVIDQQNPWLSPGIRVTKLSNGQFYVKDLSPGSYELIITMADFHQSIPFTISSGNVRSLKTIYL